jgi:hypothetical protein
MCSMHHLIGSRGTSSGRPGADTNLLVLLNLCHNIVCVNSIDLYAVHAVLVVMLHVEQLRACDVEKRSATACAAQTAPGT